MLDKVCATCANRFLECVGNVRNGIVVWDDFPYWTKDCPYYHKEEEREHETLGQNSIIKIPRIS